MRERLFSAVRTLVEAASAPPAAGLRGRGHPLGRRGDARPDRVPGALGPRPGAAGLPGARRAARPPPRLGRRAPERDHADARPARPATRRASWSPRCCGERRPATARRSPSRSPSARAATRCSPRRWSTGSSRRARATPRRCPRRSTRCSPRGSTRCRARAPRAPARRGGRPDLLGGLGRPTPASRAHRPPRRSSRCGQGPDRPDRRQPARRRARVRVQARADPRRRLLDPAEGGARAPARRGRRRSSPTRAADRSEGVIAMVAEHYSRAAALGAAADLEPGELEAIDARALEALEAAGDASAALYSNSEAQGHYEAALVARAATLEPATRARGSPRSSATSRCGSGASIARSRAWEQCMEYHRGEEDLARVGDLHRKIGAGLWQKGDREGSIEHYQRGIDLLKDGPPCLELVRLYEEAASLYMHTGDNMLAIYASEKALRLAERLGEAAAASRAHGIFGRVFGRIGDSERARENLERSVELARETDPGGGGARAVRARLPPRGLRGRLRGRARGLRRGARDRRARPATCRRRWRSTRRSPRSPSTAATGRRPSARPTPRRRSPSARAWPASSASRTRCAACCSGTTASSTRRSRCSSARSSRPTRSGARRSRSSRCTGWPAPLRDRGDHADADQALARALDLCERAGLVAQSVEATAARAVNLRRLGQGRGGARAGRGGGGPGRAAALPGGPRREPRGPRRGRRPADAGAARRGREPPGRRSAAPLDAERVRAPTRASRRSARERRSEPPRDGRADR